MASRHVVSGEPTEHGPNLRTEEHVSAYGCELALRVLLLARGQVVRAWCKPGPVDATQATRKPMPSPKMGMALAGVHSRDFKSAVALRAFAHRRPKGAKINNG
jgi:hypothetical protein